MGLDMYLYTKVYNYSNEFNIDTKVIGDLTSLTYESAYWRKVNFIHNWFVNNCQDGIDDCRNQYVSINDLKNLLDDCKQVMNNQELSESLLPTTSGFFFGGIDYDECYFEDLQYTIDILQKIIENDENIKDYHDYYYSSSW